MILEFNPNILNLIPTKPGVYLMRDSTKKLVYVGKAKNLRKRISDYFSKNLSAKTINMIANICYIEHNILETEAVAFLEEARLIKVYKPKYNILLKEDKLFTYLKIDTTTHPPILTLVKSKNNNSADKENSGLLLGPFATYEHAKNTLNKLNKIFLLRTCSDSYFQQRKRPCLQYQIKQCSAPCVGKISPLDYSKLVKQAISFLKGQSQEVYGEIEEEMNLASQQMHYEQAAIFRDRLSALKSTLLSQRFLGLEIADGDIFIAINHEGVLCIQLFIYRHRNFLGNKIYFPNNVSENIEESLESFMGQFYQSHIPPENIMINVPISPNKLNILEEALYELYKCRTKITSRSTNLKKSNLPENLIILPHLALLTENHAQNLQETQQHFLDSHISEIKPQIKQEMPVNPFEYAESITRSLAENRILNINKQQDRFEKIQELFGIPKEIKRIEVCDNSHLMGANPVGVLIVATMGGFIKHEYRSFLIKNVNIFGGNDYGMLKEVLERRLKDQKEQIELPELIIIDGGKGHLSVAHKVLIEMGYDKEITIIAMSKAPNRRSGNENFHSINKPSFTLDNSDPTMQYLQVLRDEAHNFALKNHQIRRNKI